MRDLVIVFGRIFEILIFLFKKKIKGKEHRKKERSSKNGADKLKREQGRKKVGSLSLNFFLVFFLIKKVVCERRSFLKKHLFLELNDDVQVFVRNQNTISETFSSTFRTTREKKFKRNSTISSSNFLRRSRRNHFIHLFHQTFIPFL